jgi:simple sugar transport system permease protein
MGNLWSRIRSSKAGNILIVFAVVQIACIVASWIFGDRFAYTSVTNIQTLLKSIPPLAILAVGVGILMIAGEFDLSVGSNFAFTSYIMAFAYGCLWSPWAAMLLALSIGALIGFINGLITLKARIPSFIATLGAMMFWRGMLQILSGNESASMSPGGTFEAVFAGNIGPIQAQFIWAILIALLGSLLLERHKLGNHIFGVGGNVESARSIGVYPNTVKMICFVIVGLLASFAGVISTARVYSVSPDQGKGLELQAIAACVIGGVSLMGGEGSILGLFLGAALLYTIQDVLLLLRAPGTYLEMFMGILIVVAVIFNRYTKKDKG